MARGPHLEDEIFRHDDARLAAHRRQLRSVGGTREALTMVEAGGDEVPADVVVLAVGNSARAVYAWAAAAGVPLFWWFTRRQSRAGGRSASV